MAGCFLHFHLQHFHLQSKHRRKTKSLESLSDIHLLNHNSNEDNNTLPGNQSPKLPGNHSPKLPGIHSPRLRRSSGSDTHSDQSDGMTLTQSNKFPHKLGRLFRSKSEQGLKASPRGSPSNSPKPGAPPRRRLLRVIRDDESAGEEWENPHVVRRYTKSYWEEQMQKAQQLQHSQSMPYTVNSEHTILKKTQSTSTDSDNEGSSTDQTVNKGNLSPTTNKHACFKEQVQVIEFVGKEKITKHIHFMHETSLVDSEEEEVVLTQEGVELDVTVSEQQQQPTKKVDSLDDLKAKLKQECKDEFKKAKTSLDSVDEDMDSDIDISGQQECSDTGAISDTSSSVSSDENEEPKKTKKKKRLRLHFFTSSVDKDSDSEVKTVKHMNKKLMQTHIQTEVDRET